MTSFRASYAPPFRRPGVPQYTLHSFNCPCNTMIASRACLPCPSPLMPLLLLLSANHTRSHPLLLVPVSQSLPTYHFPDSCAKSKSAFSFVRLNPVLGRRRRPWEGGGTRTDCALQVVSSQLQTRLVEGTCVILGGREENEGGPVPTAKRKSGVDSQGRFDSIRKTQRSILHQPSRA